MKKILTIAVAMIAMAMTVSATNVKWGLGEGETLPISDGTAYLVLGSLPSTTGWDEKESFSTADLGGTIMDYGSIASSTYSGEKLINDVSGSTGRYDFFVAAISADGKTIVVPGTTTRIQIKNNTNSSLVVYDGANFTSYTYVPPTPPTPPIPEPTTVALLALGLAALGLKRKVA